MNATNLKACALTRAVSANPHSISQRLPGFLNNTWTSATPRAVTHVNCDYIIVLTDGDSAVTHNSPAWPEARVNLKREVIGLKSLHQN